MLSSFLQICCTTPQTGQVTPVEQQKCIFLIKLKVLAIVYMALIICPQPTPQYFLILFSLYIISSSSWSVFVIYLINSGWPLLLNHWTLLVLFPYFTMAHLFLVFMIQLSDHHFKRNVPSTTIYLIDLPTLCLWYPQTQ